MRQADHKTTAKDEALQYSIQAPAFRNLEGAVCSLEHMSVVCAEAMEFAADESRKVGEMLKLPPGYGGISDAHWEQLLFLNYHLNEMVVEFKKQYYRCYTGDDISIVAAAAELSKIDRKLEDLHHAFGDDADSKPEYQELEERRFSLIEGTLTVQEAHTWSGIRAKAGFIPKLTHDPQRATKLAVSIADDIARMPAAGEAD